MNKLIKVRFMTLLILIFSFFLTPGYAHAETIEKINSFHSDIVINNDSSMNVTETIKVTSEGINIVHGIYRDIPTIYKDSIGNKYSVGFKVLSVMMDGADEDFTVQNMENGKRIKIGNKDVEIARGQHTFTIKYFTNRQLGFFDKNDELFWNVTGNGWNFQIDEASATVSLPKNVSEDKLTLDGFTGVQGSTEKNLTSVVKGDGIIEFMATKRLYSYEGMSILIDFPKGIVSQPTAIQNLVYLLNDNMATLLIFIGTITVLGYFVFLWLKYGKDPGKGVIIPLYAPPRDFTPEQIRYVRHMGFDQKAFTATIINMAVKGYINITEDKKLISKVYTINKTGRNEGSLTEEEAALARHMPNTIILKQENYRVVQSMISVLSGILDKWNDSKYFRKNSRHWISGLVISLFVSIIPLAIFSYTISALTFLPLFIIVLINIIFYWLLKAPTLEGRKLMDEIEGFKMFLEVTEKDRLNLLNPPEKTPELFERYLPYALALDVEQRWAQQFTDVFRRLEESGSNYHPAWYYGNAWSLAHIGAFSNDIGSAFSQAIAASATPPGSKGGGFGGSGGGGGGGGGGGW